MNTGKWKLAFWALPVIIATVGLIAASGSGVPVKALSDSELASLTGGAKWCDEDCGYSNCKCETHDCSDIECSMCSDLAEPRGDYWCKGNDGDSDDVTACYDTSDSSDSCTEGTPGATNCDGDSWNSSGCSGAADDPDLDFENDGCT